METLAPGQALAGYRIESVAGRGGMGIVYRATQVALGRPVALKLLTAELAADEAFRQRFRREWETAAAIDHPNVIPLYEAGESADGQLFIAMRFVDGVDLAYLSADGPMAAERAVRLVAQIGAALDAAHARGLVHRDVKPANVLVGACDHVYLTDFGLSREATQTRLTRTGLFVGSTDYAAPEQVRGEATDARTDVYALGCVLFQLLTASVPFARSGDMAKMYAHITEPPPLVSDVRPDVPEFDAIVERAMAKDPDDRFQSAGALAAAATAAVRGASRPGWDTAPVGLAAFPSSAARPQSSTPGWATGPSPATNPAVAPAPAGRNGPAGASAPLAVIPGSRAAGFAATSHPATNGTATASAAAASGAAASGAGANGAAASGAATGPQSELVRAAQAQLEAERGASAARALAAGTALPDEGARHVAAGHDRAGGAAPTGPVARVAAGEDSLSGPAVVSAVTSARGAKWPRLAAGVALPLVLVAGIVAAVLAATSGTEERRVAAAATATPTATATATATAAPARAVETIEVGRRPDGVAVSQGKVFVANHGAGSLTTIDPETNRTSDPIDAGTRPDHVVAGKGVTWVGVAGDDRVARFESGQRTASVKVGDRPEAIALGKQLLWVANRNDGTVNRVDRAAPALVGSPIGVGREPAGIFVGRRFVWVTNAKDGTVNRIDPSTAQLVGDAIPTGKNPRGVIETRNATWIANADDGTVTRLDRKTGKPLDAITVGRQPRELAQGFGSVWVTNNQDNTVTRIDEQTGRIQGAPIPVGEHPLGIATGAGSVWVANHESSTVTRIQP
ncbi:protein kinase [Solirubrobacter phytolaccae]|uniref:non-specific serine/threonine protein kinase n=1 Tax=Solirubrobacter phytolaccae TaxID=1404360 RepID=A0A9X3NEP3_9ACTN|nr:serine/threonine-protein kinase [Solirubrobacter phytolaccae]MDA0184651.1 protein kinase [Solirubrobacter phytolaccae]